MLNFMDILAIAGFFALRIGVPLLVMVGIGYLLKRLDRRWEAEARAMQERAQPAERPAVRPGATRPGTTVRVPAAPPALPWVPPPAVGRTTVPQPGLMAQAAPQPCWKAKGCNESQRAACPAPQHPEVPCWQARFDAEGVIPEDCVKCDAFQRYPMM
jgi:hypothetical protein